MALVLVVALSAMVLNCRSRAPCSPPASTAADIQESVLDQDYLESLISELNPVQHERFLTLMSTNIEVPSLRIGFDDPDKEIAYKLWYRRGFAYTMASGIVIVDAFNRVDPRSSHDSIIANAWSAGRFHASGIVEQSKVDQIHTNFMHRISEPQP